MSCFHTSLSRAHPTHRARPSHRAPVQLTPWHTRPHPEHQRKASRCKAALPFHRAPVQLTPWHTRPLPGHQRKASRCKAALPPSLGGPALPATQQQPGTQSSATSNVKARAYDLCLSLGITQSTGFRLASSHPDMKVSDLAARTAQLAKQVRSRIPGGLLLLWPLPVSNALSLTRSLAVCTNDGGVLTLLCVAQHPCRRPVLASQQGTCSAEDSTRADWTGERTKDDIAGRDGTVHNSECITLFSVPARCSACEKSCTMSVTMLADARNPQTDHGRADTYRGRASNYTQLWAARSVCRGKPISAVITCVHPVRHIAYIR